jgi:major membrane immunogen (membrane-anchored lipoprotein)
LAPKKYLKNYKRNKGIGPQKYLKNYKNDLAIIFV